MIMTLPSLNSKNRVSRGQKPITWAELKAWQVGTEWRMYQSQISGIPKHFFVSKHTVTKVSMRIITFKDFLSTDDNTFTFLHNTSISFVPGMGVTATWARGKGIYHVRPWNLKYLSWLISILVLLLMRHSFQMLMLHLDWGHNKAKEFFRNLNALSLSPRSCNEPFSQGL